MSKKADMAKKAPPIDPRLSDQDVDVDQDDVEVDQTSLGFGTCANDNGVGNVLPRKWDKSLIQTFASLFPNSLPVTAAPIRRKLTTSAECGHAQARDLLQWSDSTLKALMYIVKRS
jgi:hypothetical protein